MRQGGVALLGTLCLPSPVQLMAFGLEYAVIVSGGQVGLKCPFAQLSTLHNLTLKASFFS